MSDDERPRDPRKDWELPTFREVKAIMDERDRRYDDRFRSIERTLGHSFIGLIALGFIAVTLVAVILVAFVSGQVR
jgi:hypothetical protein